MFKLYYYYNKRDGNGWPGLALTILFYSVLLFINASLLYYYLIFVHMGGRVIDIYHRLSGNVNHFFLPHDDEISLSYLKWVCAKALRFNHRVANTTDQVVNEKGKEVDVHFVHIYKFDKETHELYSYRSFIRDYDGAIREMHIKKTVLSEGDKKGLVYDLTQPNRQEFRREEYFPNPDSEEDKKEGEGDDEDPENVPFKNSNMDSRMNLREELSSRRGKSNSLQDDSRMDAASGEDRKIAEPDSDEEEDHLKSK